MSFIKVFGLMLVVISALLILICLLQKRETFFNLRNVIVKHLGLFKHCKCQYLTFYGLPLLFSIGLAMLYEAGEPFYSNLSVIISILISMLLAVLSILTGKEYSSVNNKEQRVKIHRVIDETITAIIFDTVLCVFMLLYGLVMIIVNDINFNLGFNAGIIDLFRN